jgi:predicted phosphoribosyltransferase
MTLKNREEAAFELAKRLKDYQDKNLLVVAIPRGAVGMARIIADQLGADLDVVLVHKLTHSLNAEFAIGAVDEEGQVYLDDEAQLEIIPIRYLEEERVRQWENLQRRRKLYTPVRESIDPKGRIVVIVDDGIATGWTVKAALIALKERKPQKLIVAAGVCCATALKEIKLYADEVICLETPDNFQAVSQFYQDFAQVTDEEVIKLLS